MSPRLILCAAWLVVIVYAFPGYMNFDASEQLHQARTSYFDDWHPPLMAAYWRGLDVVLRGPFLMLVLQTTLFLWGLYAVFRLRLAPRTSAIVAACLLVFPPIFTPMAPVWKDAQMAAFLLGGTLLAMQSRACLRIAGCVLLALAVGVRDNGAAALLPLLLLIASSWFTRRLHALLVALCMFVAMFGAATLTNRAISDMHSHAWHLSTAIHDIAGTICHAGPLDDAHVRELTAGIPLAPQERLQEHICAVYSPRVWFSLAYDNTKIFDHDPPKADRLARRASWIRTVRTHPLAYAKHRWAVTRELLGLTTNPPWEPVCQTFTATAEQRTRLRHDVTRSWIQRREGEALTALSSTWLFRPWMYFVLALIAAGYVIARRDWLATAFITSGLLYELSLFAFASAPDFRYSHWMITCTCIVLVLIFRARIAPPRPDIAERALCKKEVRPD